jgi:hypothetical protein
MGSAVRALWLATAAAAALGCAAAPPVAAPERVLLAPVGLGLRLPATLEPGAAPVAAELVRALEARGATVRAPGADEWGEVWRAATADVGTLTGARGGLDHARLDAAAAAAVAAWQARGERFDLLLLSQLELRSVEILAGGVAWDGVERRVRIVRDVGKRLGNWPNHQWTPCVSLRLVAYAADGARRLDQSGGIDVVSEFLVRTFGERPRADLFQDPALLREAVAVALAPLFPE